MKAKKIISIIMAMSLLAACGADAEGRGSFEPSQKEAEAEPTEAVAVAPTAVPEPAEPVEEPEELPGYIDGSGSYFVRLSDGVYFHEYSKEVFDDLALEGDFIHYIKGDGATRLCRYDEESGEVERIAEDDCVGELYWCGDRFYCDRYTGGTVYACSITPDGKTEQLCAGEILGTSVDGGWIAIWEYEPDGDASLVKVLDYEGSEIYRLNTEEYNSFQFCGLDMDTMIFRNVKEDGTVELYSYDEDGAVFLGKLDKKGGYGNPYCNQMIRNETADYLMLGWNGGPTDAYEACQVVSLRPGEKDSLVLEQDGYDPAVMPNCAEFEIPDMRFVNGELVYERCPAGTVLLSEGRHGDLWLHNDNFDQGAIAKAFISYVDRQSLKIQTAKLLGDYVYLMVAAVEYDPHEDYSWMRYYRYRDKMYYLRVRAKEDSAVERIYGDDWSKASNFDASGYEEFIGKWRMDEVSAEGETQRDPAHKDLWIWFDDSHKSGIVDDPELGGVYYLDGYTGDGEYWLGGVNEYQGHQFTAHIEDGELVVTFLQLLQSGVYSDAMTWTGYFHKASEEEWNVEWGLE